VDDFAGDDTVCGFTPYLPYLIITLATHTLHAVAGRRNRPLRRNVLSLKHLRIAATVPWPFDGALHH